MGDMLIHEKEEPGNKYIRSHQDMEAFSTQHGKIPDTGKKAKGKLYLSSQISLENGLRIPVVKPSLLSSCFLTIYPTYLDYS